jgi:hypothetical protein
VFTLVLCEELFRFSIVLSKFFHHISADVTVILLDLFGNSKRVFGRDSSFSSVSKELLNEGRDIASSDRNVSDSRTDNVTLSLRK